MFDLTLRRPFRLWLLVGVTLLTTLCIAMFWEFYLEQAVSRLLGLPYDEEFENSERWRFVLTSTLFAGLSIISPSILLRKLIANTRVGYRELRLAKEQSEHVSRVDELSGLINRRFFMKQLAHCLEAGEPTTVMLIDLDNFKVINDTYGHGCGDYVIAETGRRLNAVAQAHGATAARLGGDEFSLVHTGRWERSGLEAFAEHLISALYAPIMLEGRALQVGATVGIARAPQDAKTPSELLHKADNAMYWGKRTGRARYSFYDSGHEAMERDRRHLEERLLMGLALGEFEPYFQPIVELPKQAPVGFEILTRWVRPGDDPVMPGDFIPVIQALGRIPEMTYQVLAKACAIAADWPAHIKLSLNLTSQMIVEPFFADQLVEQLKKAGFAPERLEVEITEQALVENLDAARRNLCVLREQGITVALDDFGTGYSGLYHLARLEIDKIKIDQSFFEQGQAHGLKMADAILGMARSLQIEVTAEGIENISTHYLPDWLAHRGCQYGQGYLFGRPMPAENVAPYLATAPVR